MARIPLDVPINYCTPQIDILWKQDHNLKLKAPLPLDLPPQNEQVYQTGEETSVVAREYKVCTD